jgi:hypothetical protein
MHAMHTDGLRDLSIWMKNAFADLNWVGPQSLPITVLKPNIPAAPSYLTSLRSGWIDYAAHERASHPAQAEMIRALGWVFQAMGLDRLVLAGNFPISTNERSLQELAAMPEVCQLLQRAYPQHFIGVRNVLAKRQAELFRSLQALGYCAIPSRVVYEFDWRRPSQKLTSHMHRDLNRFRRSSLRVVWKTHFTPMELSRIEDLYGQVYLEKHSYLNPQYTQKFFEDAVSVLGMRCLCLVDTCDRIMAFSLVSHKQRVVTVPALGYDTQDAAQGLYRHLFAALYQELSATGCWLNYSSGAGDFKRKRGGVPALEYTLVRAPENSGWMTQAMLKVMERLGSKVTVERMMAWGA